ncbi:hypothetical protein Adt_03895 [Abeliophyllum distichum]|uniref:Uncharacterized protein n=1 Tax=Abeliophyllum distichum TaxID=126358 RepID=A0ABD1W031_9LAMI
MAGSMAPKQPTFPWISFQFPACKSCLKLNEESSTSSVEIYLRRVWSWPTDSDNKLSQSSSPRLKFSKTPLVNPKSALCQAAGQPQKQFSLHNRLRCAQQRLWLQPLVGWYC